MEDRTDRPEACPNAEHDSVLEAVVVGDLAEDSAEARAVLEGCAPCRAKLAELRAVTGLIDDEVAQMRDVFAESATVVDAPGADRVHATIAGQTGGGTITPMTRPIGRRAFAAAAALLVVAGAAFFVGKYAGDEGPDSVLGIHSLECVFPRGEVDAVGYFEWAGELPDGEFFVIEFYDDAGDTDVAPLKKIEYLTETRWEVRDPLPWSRFQWRVVTTNDLGGKIRTSEFQRVSIAP